MKDVNFINTVSPRAQRSIQRWYYISCVLIFLAVVCMIGMHIPQLYMWRALKGQRICGESNSGHILQEEVRQLQEQEKQLKAYITRVEKNGTRLGAWRERITQLFGNGLAMQSCDMDAKGARLLIQSTSLDHAKNIVNRLQACPSVKSVNLLSLQPMSGGSGYLCNCVCEWK